MTHSAPSRAATSRSRTFLGGCDCGTVLYEVELDEERHEAHTDSVWERSVPTPRFRLLAGDESLSGHQFADQNAYHFYCDRCGARAYTHWAPGAEAACYSFDLKGLRRCLGSDHYAARTGAG